MADLTEDTVSGIIDGILKFVAAGGFITTALVAPNAVQVLDKPLHKALDKLDKRARERELRRITYYMKREGLIAYNIRDYENGIKLTREGRRRLLKKDFESIEIKAPQKWDKKWRLVFFDIPIEHNYSRQRLTKRLRLLGFQQLQKSIWIHPFRCREEIEVIAETIGIRKYLTYIEISEIDADKLLRKRFKNILKTTH